MRICKTHPVICKHQWQHGRFPVNNPNQPMLNVLVDGYFCHRCHTVWKTQLKDGIIKPLGDEPRIEIGICEIEIPTLSSEPPQK